VEGIAVGLSWVVLLVVLRHSRAKVAVSDAIILAIFTLAVCLRVRMVAWYGPIWMLVLAPHLRDVLEHVQVTRFGEATEKRFRWASQGSSRIFLFSALGIWLTFTFSPMSTFVLGGKPRTPDMQYHSGTPLGVTEYLREHPPQGMIFNPQWWGDWLAWQGPKDMQVMMTTNAVHVVPPKVWRDYLAISAGLGGLDSRLAKYRINTLVVHKELQSDLERILRQSLAWKIVYEDDLGLVAVRRSAISIEEQSEQPPANEELSRVGMPRHTGSISLYSNCKSISVLGTLIFANNH
jgi:hypothetical protein